MFGNIKMKISLIICTLMCSLMMTGQYVPLKNVEMRGIMWPSGPSGNNGENCSGTNPLVCPTYNVTGMNWYMSGVTGSSFSFSHSTLGWSPFNISNRDYAMVYEGNIEVRDPNGAICFNSPVLNISGLGTINMSFSVTRPGAGTTYVWVNFNYRVNGGATQSSGNLTGGTGVTSSWNPTASGNTLELWSCMNATGNDDVYRLVSMNTNLGAPLPVRWMGIFSSLDKERRVHLSWSTASEVNNDFFEVQRSMDENRYEVIGEVKGAGNTTDRSQYTFIDETAIPGNTYYYRVKQVDFDGQTDYSIPLKVVVTSMTIGIRISSNPVEDILRMDIDKLPDFPAEVYIYSMQGQLLLSKVLDDAQSVVELDISQLPPGAYFVSSNVMEFKPIKIIKVGQE